MKFFTILILSLVCLFLNAQNIPVDFEDGGFGKDWTWTIFENDTNPPLEIVDNPDKTGLNSSQKVAKFTALVGGMPFAGCETLHGSDIGSFTITEENSKIGILVWKSTISDVGIKLVREDNWSLGEIKVPNTKINEWEYLEFDFSSHLGLPYDQIVVFPDFTARTEDQIVYFDNIFGNIVLQNNNTSLQNEIVLYPNPVSTELNIHNQSGFIENVEIYNSSGLLVFNMKVLSNSEFLTLNIAQLASGIYYAKCNTSKGIILKKFMVIE